MLLNSPRKTQGLCDMQMYTYENKFWHPFVKSLLRLCNPPPPFSFAKFGTPIVI